MSDEIIDLTEPDAEPDAEQAPDVDNCPTPPELALAIVREARARFGDSFPQYPEIFEPSAGEGAFVAAALAVWPGAHITAVEPREECGAAIRAAGAERVFETTLEATGVPLGTDLVIGNPPFSRAETHLRLLFAGLTPGTPVVMLLRLAFLESFERLPFWREFPAGAVQPIVPRPGFKLNGKGKPGTDSQAYAVFYWRAGEKPEPTTLLPALVWREEKRKAAAIETGVTPAKKPRKPRKDKGQPRKPVEPPVEPPPAQDLEVLE